MFLPTNKKKVSWLNRYKSFVLEEQYRHVSRYRESAFHQSKLKGTNNLTNVNSSAVQVSKAVDCSPQVRLAEPLHFKVAANATADRREQRFSKAEFTLTFGWTAREECLTNISQLTRRKPTVL